MLNSLFIDEKDYTQVKSSDGNSYDQNSSLNGLSLKGNVSSQMKQRVYYNLQITATFGFVGASLHHNYEVFNQENLSFMRSIR